MATASTAAPPRRSVWSGVGWLLVTVYVASSVVGGWAERSISAYPATDPLLATLGLVLGFGWFALVGAVVISRRPRNLLGWILVAISVPLAVFAAGNNVAAYLVLERGHEPTLLISLLAWPNNWSWYATLTLIFVFVPLVFPTGRLLSPRWRPVAWLAALGAGGMCVLGAVASDIGFQVSQSDDGPGASIPNPLGVDGLVHVEQLPVMALFGGVLVVAIVAAFASLVVRFRRSRGVERRQMTWLVLAAALVPPTVGLEILFDALGFEGPAVLRGVGFLLAINAIPLAIGLAVLRYRLYDIDRVVSRTVSYLVLSVLLAGLYVAGVVVLGGLVRSVSDGGGGDLVVAASTLGVAAAFQPLRRRIQRIVDRRFNRARYDASREIERFGARLRDEVDPDAIARELVAATYLTLQPERTSLWLVSTGQADR
jgi:hypothetical protein